MMTTVAERRWLQAAIFGVALAAAAAGCGSTADSRTANLPAGGITPPTTAPTTMTNKVKEIANRTRLPACGSYTILPSPPSTVAADRATADKCILDSFREGRPAEVV